MVSQNKRFSFKIKRQAINVFPRDVERTVVASQSGTITLSGPNYSCLEQFSSLKDIQVVEV